MKKYIVILLLVGCTKKSDFVNVEVIDKPKIDSTNISIKNYQVTSQEINFELPNISISQLYGTSTNSVAGFLNYSKDGIENVIITPSTQTQDLYPVHFYKKDNVWTYENYYSNVQIGSIRNYEKISDGSYVYADHGREYGTTWPYGHIWKFETIDNKLKWTQVSKVKSFFHSVSTGDFNSDGLIDIVGLHMGTFNNWYDNLHTFTQNTNTTFDENREILTSVNFRGPYGAGSVLSVNLFGDSKPEIIRADYGFNDDQASNFIRYSIVIFSYDDKTKFYEPVRKPGVIGIFTNNKSASTSMKAFDYDKDGDLDLAIAYEGVNNGIEIWENKGDGNFLPTNQRIEFTEQELQFREFEIADVNNDGYIDILLHPFHYGLFFRDGRTTYTFGDFGTGIKLNKCILLNNKGKFEFYQKDITIPNIKPGFMKASFINNKLKFMGLEYNSNKLLLHEININL